MINSERILCCAIHYNNKSFYKGNPDNIHSGIVISGFRHDRCLKMLHGLFGSSYDKTLVQGKAQGFLTSKNRFVSREEAFKIHKVNYPDLKPFDDFNGELFSEDLY